MKLLVNTDNYLKLEGDPPNSVENKMYQLHILHLKEYLINMADYL